MWCTPPSNYRFRRNYDFSRANSGLVCVESIGLGGYFVVVGAGAVDHNSGDWDSDARWRVDYYSVGQIMTPRTWALKRAEKFVVNDNIQGPIVAFFRVAGLVESEHARAVRIVEAEIKRVKMDDYSHTEETRKMILYSLNKLLTMLQRGRGGKGDV